jgi:hypothetical protein
MSDARVGVPKSDETRERMRQARLGRKHSPETRAKIARTMADWREPEGGW